MLRKGGSAKDTAAPSTRDFERQFKDFKAELSSLFAASYDKVLDAMQMDDALRAADEIRNIFDTATRQGLSLGEALSSADIELNRKSLKAQENIFKLKLEASRTAASVQMQNQAAELEANAKAQMEAKKREMLEGGSAELQDAIAQVEELGQANHNLRIEVQRQEELIKATKRENDKEVKKLNDTIGELEVKRAEAHEEAEQAIMRLEMKLKSAMEEAEEAIERARAEAGAGDPDEELEAELEEMRSQVSDLRSRLSSYEEVMVLDEVSPPPGKRSVSTRVSRERFDELEVGEQALSELRIKLELAVQRAQVAEERAKTAETMLASSGSAGANASELAASLSLSQSEVNRLQAELNEARDAMFNSSAEGARLLEARDAASRMLLETLARSVGEVQGAMRSTAEAARSQLTAMAARLQGEIEGIKEREREAAQDQLTRLLGELSTLKARSAELEGELSRARHEGGDALARKLQFYRDDERSCRAALTLAAGELGVTLGGEREPLSEALGTILGHYRRMTRDMVSLSGELDSALRDVAMNNAESTNLADRVHALLRNYGIMRREAEHIKGQLDWALSEIRVVTDDKASLSEKLKQLIVEVKNTSTNEGHLRVALKRQHNSLHNAYQKLKAVEAELVRSQGAAAEERESLVHASLNALQQLRNSLGAIHALRPEIAKPLDEALVVKHVQLHGSQSSPGIGMHGIAGQGLGQGGFGASGAMLQAESRQKIESFMHRIAVTAGALVVGADPAGVGQLVRAAPAVDPFEPGRRNPAQASAGVVPFSKSAYHSQQQQQQQYGSPMPMHGASSPDWSAAYSVGQPSGKSARLRPLTPGLTSGSPMRSPSLMAHVGPATLRVPQPKGGAHGRGGLLPSASSPGLSAMMMSPPATRATRSILPPDVDEYTPGVLPQLSGSRPSSAKAPPA